MSPHAATIIAVEGDAKGLIRKFASGVPIGRGPQNVFSFPDDDCLQDQHTGICLQRDHHWYVLNTNPEAATYIDGMLVTERFTLIPSGSIVRCGRQAFQVIYGNADFDRELHRSQLEAGAKAIQTAIRSLLDGAEPREPSAP